ncbi:hypothetical protein [Luteolibacter sp. LG18]|uniref:hypothetical protein n=1 Tax=Luteolibacter sp. LG18 TaxID=2819286 RepID=UPI002B2F30B1|nr:hypothetical protein llg_09300 [Luteolibacter sp. LG18]
MKAYALTLFAIVLTLVVGELTGLVGIFYPKVVRNQPLVNPVRVASVDGDKFTLEDGRVFECITGDLAMVGNEIEVQADSPREYTVAVEVKHFICPCFQGLIRIPLIPQKIDSYSRRVVAGAKVVSERP